MCDPDETRITKENAVNLCRNESTAEDWRKCLEKVCDLLEACGFVLFQLLVVFAFVQLMQLHRNRPVDAMTCFQLVG